MRYRHVECHLEVILNNVYFYDNALYVTFSLHIFFYLRNGGLHTYGNTNESAYSVNPLDWKIMSQL